MNRADGAALLARVRAGDRVTVRRKDGGQSTGRAELDAAGAWRIRTGPLFSEPVTAHNIVRIVNA